MKRILVSNDDGIDAPGLVALVERAALDRRQGNKNRAAELLRIKRTTLVEKLKRLEGHGH